MSASSIDLAVIPGDGIGPEVIAEALKVLEKAVAAEGVELKPTHYELGADHWLPGNQVHDIASGDRSVCIATDKGVSIIRYEPYTLAMKAVFVMPGDTRLTVMPCGPSSAAR